MLSNKNTKNANFLFIVDMMVTQDEFNRDYFTTLASYITLGEQGRVVLHTKTETEVTLDDGSNESP